MTTKKHSLLASRTMVGLLAFIIVIAIGAVALAYYGEVSPVSIENNYGDINIPPATEAPVVETDKPLGAIPGYDIVNPYLSINDDRTYYVTGRFLDATTTIVAFANPFKMATTSVNQVGIAWTSDRLSGWTGATSTVESVTLNITQNATSSYHIVCGAAASISATSTVNILYSSGLISTSTPGTASTTGMMITNNIASTTVTDLKIIGGGTVSKIMLTPQLPYFTCRVYTHDTDWPTRANAFTNAVNLFDGYYAVRISKPGM